MGHPFDLAPFWLRLFAGFAAGAATWIVSVDLGIALVNRWIHFEHSAARIGVSSAFGYALIGSTVALLGLVAGIHTFTLWLLLAVAIVLRAPVHVRRLRALPAHLVAALNALRQLDGVARLSMAVAIFAALTALVSAALPAVWWDPIAYHLPLTAAALWHGAFAFDPHMVQSGFPQLGEAAALPAYAIAGSAGASMVTLGAGLSAALLVWALADGMARGSGILAALLVLSSGLWLWLAPSFYVDVPFAMFVVAAIVTALQLTQQPAPSLAVGALCGGLCGASASIKYSGLGAALVVFALILFLAGSGRLKTALGFASGFAAIAAGWYARTFALTGDPLYPFLSPAIAKSSVTREFASRYIDMTRHWCGGGTSFSDLATLPYRLIFHPKSFCGDPGLALGVGIIFFIAACVVIRRARIIALAGLILTVLWFMSSQQWRFALAALFLYAGIVAAGTAAAGDRLRPISATIMTALCAVVILTNWTTVTRREASSSIVPAFAYIGGLQTAAAYLDTRLESFAAARWLADRGIDGDQVIALDDVRDYYFPKGTVWANPYYQQVLRLNWKASPRLRYGELTARGVKYMVVNRNAAYVHRTPTGVDWSALAMDERHGLHVLFSANEVFVYDVSSVR